MTQSTEPQFHVLIEWGTDDYTPSLIIGSDTDAIDIEVARQLIKYARELGSPTVWPSFPDLADHAAAAAYQDAMQYAGAVTVTTLDATRDITRLDGDRA